MGKNLALNHIAVSVGNLEAYMSYVSSIPMLSQEEEFELARKFYEENDLNAARQLVLAHLRFVMRIARGYVNYGLPLGDLIQEGNIGLMKAVKKYNPHVGVRLVTFAVHWIKSEIHEFILKNWRIVKIATTKAQRKLFFNLRQYKKRLGWFNREEIEAVANDLGVSPEEVVSMEEKLNSYDEAFHASSDELENDHAPENYLGNTTYEPTHLLENHQAIDQHTAVKNALLALDDRSQDIIKKRFLNDKKATLHELASTYGVSAERIRQLESSAIQKLKQSLITIQ